MQAAPSASSNPPARRFEPLVAASLAPHAIEALLQRRVPYVLVPRFLEPAWCAEVVGRFARAIDALPDHRGLVMGPMCFDSLVRPLELFVDGGLEPYFAHVPEDQPRVRALFEGGADPLALVGAAWAAAGFREVPAREGADRTYLTDAVWGITAAVAPPHVDGFERERECALSRFPRRFNWNVYLQNADSGGAFVIYDKHASETPPGVQPWRDPEAAAAMFEGVARLEHRPSPGDLVIFDAMLFHEVTRVEGTTRRRVQVHSGALVDPGAREIAFFV